MRMVLDELKQNGMRIIVLEIGDLSGLIFLIVLVMFGPALLFLIVGIILWSRQKKKIAKIFYILSGIYLLVSLGICGALVTF